MSKVDDRVGRRGNEEEKGCRGGVLEGDLKKEREFSEINELEVIKEIKKEDNKMMMVRERRGGQGEEGGRISKLSVRRRSKK